MAATDKPAEAAPAEAAPAEAAPAEAAPATRELLLARHAEARRRRSAAALGSHEWEQAQAEIGRIEVEIARIERAMDPPRA